MGIAIYSNTLAASFQFDDVNSVVENSNIRNLTNLGAIWNFWPTRFVTFFSFAINYHFGHLNVFGYHLFNIAIHLCSAILVWYFALLAFAAPVMKNKEISRHARSIALFAGLVFVSHPIQIEAVTYISQRAASLATLLYLASLCLYIRSRLARQGNKARLFYAGSLIAAILAIFSKEMTITLPLMVTLCEISFFSPKNKIDWKKIIPYLAVSLLVPLTMFATNSVNFLEVRRTAETAPAISWPNYLLTEFRVMITYIRLLFMPLNQNADYDYHISKTLLEFPVLVSLALLVGIVAGAIRLFSKYTLISFGIFWFFVSLLPESSLIPLKYVIFEYRLYLAMAGYSIFLASAIYYIFGNSRAKLTFVILIFIIACNSILAYDRNFIWKDEFGLWNDTVGKSPEKARPYNNRGNAYIKTGKFCHAIQDYDLAIQLEPNEAAYYLNRANAYYRKNMIGQAISDYTKAIEIKPEWADLYIARGVAYYQRGDLDNAIEDYTMAIKINPRNAYAYNNRGAAYHRKGNLDMAISDYSEALRLSAGFKAAYINRSMAYLKKRA